MRTLPLPPLPLLAACCLLLAPAAASGQEAAAPIDEKPVQKVNEVEHGLFFGVDAGGLFLIGPKASEGGGFTPGRTFGVNLGYEIGDVVSLALLVMGTSSSTPSKFASNGSRGLRGDFSTLVLGGMAKVSFWGKADAAQVKRLYLYGRVAGGYALVNPKGFYDGGDILVLGGLGLEYFTHLRHFSLGLDANFLYGIRHLGPGFSVTPNLRYTF